MTVVVMSEKAAVRYAHRTNNLWRSVVISINNLGDTPANISKIRNNGIFDILRVYFDDEDHGDRAITTTDALKIAEFVHSYENTVDRIIVHCGAGVSRSAGVAAAILNYLNGDDSDIFDDPKYRPNMLCYRRVLWALNVGGNSGE